MPKKHLARGTVKIYETHSAPNARRVRMFLAEKGIDIDYIQVDIKGGENLSDDFKKKSETTKIPVLELDDGSCIGESVAICRYFEELYPENTPLMGIGAREKAEVEMWQRRVEWYFMAPVGMCFQHSTGYFKDRMTPVPAWADECAKQVVRFYSLLEERLAQSSFIAGESFSIADITALCAIDFARVIKIRPADDQIHLQRWLETMRSRDSAQA